MRISKKFVGLNCIGKQVFRRRQDDELDLSQDDIEKRRSELAAVSGGCACILYIYIFVCIMLCISFNFF
jgi:hypothetical protein